MGLNINKRNSMLDHCNKLELTRLNITFNTTIKDHTWKMCNIPIATTILKHIVLKTLQRLSLTIVNPKLHQSYIWFTTELFQSKGRSFLIN